jgi:hypothetical protein
VGPPRPPVRNTGAVAVWLSGSSILLAVIALLTR